MDGWIDGSSVFRHSFVVSFVCWTVEQVGKEGREKWDGLGRV